MNNNSTKSLFSDLWERRVPQFLATYIGVSWGITQFLIFASSRYGLDSSYIDKFLLFVLILLPSIIVFTYNHGRPGDDSWLKYEKILIPFNLLLALGIASFAGKGNDIQAAPNEVQITTLDGDTIIRMVPAISQTKSFALFPFKNKDGNAENDWLRFGMPLLMSTDLEQDIRMYCLSPFSMDYEYGSQNYQLSDDIPFSSKLKIAKNRIAQYFVDGEYSKSGQNYTASIKVFETRNGEEFFSKQYTDTNLYSIIDQFCSEISDNLFLKESSNDLLEVVDLPAQDLISANLEAFKKYSLSTIESKLNNNPQSALEYAQQADALDNTSAEIKKLLASNIYMTGDVKSAQLHMKDALQMSDKLSERQKLNLKAIYYIYHQEIGKAIQLWETWRTLYPRDFYPFTQLMEFYTMTRNFAKAKNVGLEAIKSGHKNRILKPMANVCIQRDELEEAENYLLEYLELYPDKAKNDTQLAEIYESKGELAKSKKYLEKIELMNPEDHRILIKLANVIQMQGDYELAGRYLDKALEKADLTEDSVSVYFNKMYYFLKVADKDGFLASANKRIELLESISPKISVASATLQFTGFYSQFGLEDVILDYNAEIIEQAPQFKPTFDCVTDFIISMTKENTEKFKSTYTGYCKEILLNSQPEIDYLAQGLLAKMEGNNKDAIRFFEIYIDSTGGSGKEYGSMLAEVYRKSGDNKSAIKACENYLKKDTAHPYFLLELAKAQLADGQKTTAKKNYLILKDIWKKIDPSFILYPKFKSLEADLANI